MKYTGVYSKSLKDKNVALIFEKPSTRTRCAFVVACVDEGAHPEYLGKNDIQMGKKERGADPARVYLRYQNDVVGPWVSVLGKIVVTGFDHMR